MWLWVLTCATIAFFIVGNHPRALVQRVLGKSFEHWLMSGGHGVYREYTWRLRCLAHISSNVTPAASRKAWIEMPGTLASLRRLWRPYDKLAVLRRIFCYGKPMPECSLTSSLLASTMPIYELVRNLDFFRAFVNRSRAIACLGKRCAKPVGIGLRLFLSSDSVKEKLA